MNEIRVVPTANAGAILYLGGFCVWTDVLNEENQGGYEVLSDEAFRRILREPAFRPDAVLFTHRHHDHYSEERVMKAAEAWPDALIYVGGASPCGKELDLTAPHGALRIRTIPLPHDGVRYAEVLNEAILSHSSSEPGRKRARFRRLSRRLSGTSGRSRHDQPERTRRKRL